MISHRGRSRRGGIAIVAVICLVLIAALSTSLMRTVAQSRQQEQMASLRLQAELLAGAGLDRARAQLADDPDYAGETWAVSAAELAPGTAGAEVLIEVKRQTAGAATITVVSSYPHGTDRAVKFTRTISRKGRVP